MDLPNGRSVKSDAPRKTVLGNGLAVLTAARAQAPVVSVLLLYRAGLLQEPPGKTGLAHLTEHMMFRGTPRFPQGAVDAETGRLGGINNAMTTSDYTAYYFVLPPEHWRVPLAIEADRMVNSVLSDEAFETERRVAVEERKMLDDDPESVLDEALDALAFERHPYRYPVVGLREDLDRLTIEDLRHYYARYYVPNNAVLVVAGDLLHEEVAVAVQGLFGDIESTTLPVEVPRPEPDQVSPRHVALRGETRSPEMAVAFRCPSAAHPDTPALELLAAVLAIGRSSRLYRTLVHGERIATDVSATRVLQRDPGLFSISAALLPGEDVRRCENTILDVLDSLRTDGISDDEIGRARNLVLVDLLHARETCLGLAGALGFWESMAGWELGPEFERAIGHVSAEDLHRVLETYFHENGRNTAWLMPRDA